MFYSGETFTYSGDDQMQPKIIYPHEFGISRGLRKQVTFKQGSLSRNIITILLALLISSCATVYTIDDDPDHKLPPLKVGDQVTVYTSDHAKEEFVIARIDSEYIYGEKNRPKIRKDEIRMLEFSGDKTGPRAMAIFGVILFGLLFSG